MFTIQVPINELKKDYLFYKFVSGPNTDKGNNYMNQALKIWTTNIQNSKTNEPLDSGNHNIHIRQLFSALHARGVPYTQSDFKKK